MKVSATQKHARMSPRKLRPYARLIQGMSVTVARQQLSFATGKAPVIILDVLKSAIANAIHNLDLSEKDLKVASILVNQGLVMKRFMPVSKGMAHPILKRTAHVTVIVEGEAAATDKKKKSKKADAIATISTDEFVALEQKAQEKEEQESSEQPLTKHATPERADGKKKTINQAGSDAKKTHRRKSIG